MKIQSGIKLAAVVALIGALTGCVDYVDGPLRQGAYGQYRQGYNGGGGVIQDDYMYYPRQQVYYSSNRRQYVYQDSGFWVTRATPPRAYSSALHGSPSVRVDFHDSPQNHHANVVKQYPTQWSPAGKAPKTGQGNKDRAKKDDRQNRQ